MKNEFYKWYKQRFEKLAEESPAEVWETIARTLDKDAMSSSTTSKRKRLIFPLLFFLISGGIAYFILNEKQKTILASDERKTVEVINKNSSSQTSVKNNNVPEKSIHNQKSYNTPSLSSSLSSFANVPENISLENLPTPHSEEVSSVKSNCIADAAETTTTRIEKEEVNPIGYWFLSNGVKPEQNNNDDSMRISITSGHPVSNPSSDDNTISIQQIEATQQLKNSPIQILPTGFYFGNSFTVNNSWLLNNDTKNGLKKNSLDDVNLYFGNSYALLSGYNFSDKFSMQAEWMIYNKQGQKYIDYDEGHQTTRDELLDYCQFNFMVKKKTTRMAFKATTPLSFCTLTGVQYSILKSAKDVINGETISHAGNYTNNNYGVILGFGYEALLNNHWVVATSLRMDVGLKNIYAGSPAEPSQFNRTYNSSLGMQVSLAYLFIKSPK